MQYAPRVCTLVLFIHILNTHSSLQVEILQWNIGIMDMFGTSHSILYRELREVPSLWRLKYTSRIDLGPQSVSFIEEFFYCFF